MAKIVSTKYGDRRLVYLPPINLQKTKTPNVETIETDRQVPDRRRNSSAMTVVPKEYAYNKRPLQDRNTWLGAPVRSTVEGNIVTEYPRMYGDQIFQQLYQQASVGTIENYDQGQYPVVPPIEGSPRQLGYTDYGLKSMVQPAPGNQQSPRPGLLQQPEQSIQGSNPNEKHIYYGPNGEVLPGPPQPPCIRGGKEVPQNFAFEGILRFGRLKSITLIENVCGFPKIPDYLIKDLLEKYGQYEQTIVRVVSRLGRCYVHATPLIRQIPQYQHKQAGKPEYRYVPVYLNEGEEFDYEKFMSEFEKSHDRSPYLSPGNQGRRRQQWTPSAFRKFIRRSDAVRPNTYDYTEYPRWRRDDDRYPIANRRTAQTHVENQPFSPPPSRKFVHRLDALRPNTYDDIENLRWHKNDTRYGTISRRTVQSRAEHSEYKFDRRRRMNTRDDIKPLEEIDRYYNK